MEDALYKYAVVCGVTYRYLHVAPRATAKPTLLFLHGWPCTSFGWRRQVPFFVDEGYGVIVPDMLGYGGTDAPDDVNAYAAARICAQLVGLLDAEGVACAVAIGHGWGSFVASRLANYFPKRFLAFVFVAEPYRAPTPERMPVPLAEVNARMRTLVGYEALGYWHFFAEVSPAPAALMEAHLDSLLSILYAADTPGLLKTNFCPTGKLEEWLRAGRVTTPDSYIYPEEQAKHRRLLMLRGIAPTLNWFKQDVQGVDRVNVEKLSQERFHVRQPTLICTCSRDAVAPPVLAESSRPFLKDMTVVPFSSGHWLPLEDGDALNETIDKFIREKL